MKRIVFIVLSALCLFVACVKDPIQENSAKDIVFSITVNHPDNTKAVKSNWEDGDIVYVFFQDVNATKYLELTSDGSDWGATTRGGLSVSDLTASGKKIYGIYFPFEQPVIESDGGTGVTFKTGGSNPATSGLGIYTYYMTANANYTVDTSGDIATLTGTLDMQNPTGYVQFYIGAQGGKYSTPETGNREDERARCRGPVPEEADHVGAVAGHKRDKIQQDHQKLHGHKRLHLRH